MIMDPSFRYSDKQSAFFWVIATVILIIGFFAPRTLAFSTGLVGASFFFVAYFKNHKLPVPSKIEIGLFGTLLALCFLSVFWSMNPDFSTTKAVKLSYSLIPPLLLLSVSRNILPMGEKQAWITLCSFVLVAALFLISQEMTQYSLYKFLLQEDYIERSKLNRTYIVFTFVSLITQWFIKTRDISKQKKIIWSLLILFISSLSLSLAESQTAQLTYLCGLFFLFIWPVRCKRLGKLLFIGIIALSLILPCFIKPLKNSIPEEVLLQGILAHASIVHRFEVWDFTVEKIKENPLYGHGLESQRFMKSDQWMKHQNADSILHAHNIILQIWIEFGFLGILLGIAFLIFFCKKIYGEEDLHRRKLFLTVFTGCFCCAMTGYGVWQGWQIGLFFMITAIAIALTNIKPVKTKP